MAMSVKAYMGVENTEEGLCPEVDEEGLMKKERNSKSLKNSFSGVLCPGPKVVF